MDDISASKFLSLVLRHQPEVIGMSVDAEGWLDISELIRKANEHGTAISRPQLLSVVTSSDKQRFTISEDGVRIRANQGHSIASVDLSLAPTEPPNILFHGTVSKFLPSIRMSGLEKRSRNHVHLSSDLETAKKVGQRRGKPVILKITSGQMYADGFAFYVSENGVWLTEAVPVAYIQFP